MGWSTWNRFGCDIDEELVRQSADALVASGMRAAGYRYVNVDDCWMADAREPDGRLRAHPTRFPSGIAPLAAYVHARGLRLGLYQSVGSRTCAGRPGLAGHEPRDLADMAAWGVDYLKLDFCSVTAAVRADPEPTYARVSALARASGRPMVLSISTWGQGAPWRWGARVGHLWRVGGDLRDSFRDVLRSASRARSKHAFAGPGGWNDPDMLQVGNGGMTAREDRAHFALWAVLAAPLIAGNDVRRMSRATRRTLLNREVIAVDQDRRGAQGRRIARRAGTEVWVKRLSDGDRALLVLNRRRRRAVRRVDLRRLGLPAARRYRVRDLLRRRRMRSRRVVRVRLRGHGAALLRVGVRR